MLSNALNNTLQTAQSTFEFMNFDLQLCFYSPSDLSYKINTKIEISGQFRLSGGIPAKKIQARFHTLRSSTLRHIFLIGQVTCVNNPETNWCFAVHFGQQSNQINRETQYACQVHHAAKDCCRQSGKWYGLVISSQLLHFVIRIVQFSIFSFHSLIQLVQNTIDLYYITANNMKNIN